MTIEQVIEMMKTTENRLLAQSENFLEYENPCYGESIVFEFVGTCVSTIVAPSELTGSSVYTRSSGVTKLFNTSEKYKLYVVASVPVFLIVNSFTILSPGFIFLLPIRFSPSSISKTIVPDVTNTSSGT